MVLIQRWWRARHAQSIIRSYIAPSHKEKSLESTLPLSPHIIDTPRLVIRSTQAHPNSPTSTKGLEYRGSREEKPLMTTPKIIQEEEMESLILEQKLSKESREGSPPSLK